MIRIELHIAGPIHLHVDGIADAGALQQILHKLEQQGTIMSQVDDAITALQASVANLTTVDQSAITLIQGIGAQIQAAVDAALAQGATPAQLQSLTDLKSAIDAQDDALASAVSAATPAAPPAP